MVNGLILFGAIVLTTGLVVLFVGGLLKALFKTPGSLATVFEPSVQPVVLLHRDMVKWNVREAVLTDNTGEHHVYRRLGEEGSREFQFYLTGGVPKTYVDPAEDK